MAKPRKMLNNWKAPYVQPLMKLIESQSKEIIANWAVDYGEKVILPLWNKYGDPQDLRPQNALAAAREWLSGNIKLPQAKEEILRCHEAARESEGNTIAQCAARTMGQAASSIHSARHGMGLVFYGALAVAYDRLGTDAPWNELLEAAEMECYRMTSALRVMAERAVENPQIEKADRIDKRLYDDIDKLQGICTRFEPIALKLESDYKLLDSRTRGEKDGSEREHDELSRINEFMYYDGDELIGYIGICSFGGKDATLEITGMVHPGYRRCGVFSALHKELLVEIAHRKTDDVLLLCDRRSEAGQTFLRQIGAVYCSSEIEMFLEDNADQQAATPCQDMEFEKATNRDAGEVARQNAIYFGDSVSETQEDDGPNESLLPEEEEKRGMTIYLVRNEGQMTGKVHLSLVNGIGGIYGLGVLPEHRGKGYGRAILCKAIRMLKAADAGEILLQVATENATALNLYTSCGFRETSTMDYFKLS